MSARQSTPEDFALMRGGLLFGLMERFKLDHPERPVSDASEKGVLALLLGWLPVFLLASAGGFVNGFIGDLRVQAELLFALPALLAGEDYVNGRVAEAARQPLATGLLPPEEVPRYRRILDRAASLRDHRWVELTLIVLAYGLVALRFPLHHAFPRFGLPGQPLTLAAAWYFGIAVPLFWFLLLRWLWRFLIWADVLYRLSRLKLALVVTHADRTGGLRYLANTQASFSVMVFAVGAVMNALTRFGPFVFGEKGLEFARNQAIFTAAALIVLNLPLVPFTRKLVQAKRAGMVQMSALMGRHGRDFAEKWMTGPRPPESPIGEPEFSSQIDLSSTFEIADGMRWFPMRLRAGLAVVVSAFVLPVLPRLIAERQLFEAVLQIAGKFL